MSSQTTYTPDGNGWIVFDPLVATDGTTPAWWKHTARAALATTCGDGGYVKGTSVSVAPFVSWTNGTNGFKTTGSASTSLRFTGAEAVSFLLNPRSKSDGKKQCVSLFTYINSEQVLVETKTTSVNNNAWEELCFTGLSPANEYVVYVYKEYKSETDQNGAIMEIALKAPVSNPPGAISFSPAAGSVAAGTSVTLASSGASTIVYQWGASAIGEGGDWSGAVTYSGENKPVVPAAGSANTVLSVKATNENGSTYGSAAYTPVKMALKTIYSFADGIGSQEVTHTDVTITGTTEIKISDTNGRVKLTAAAGSQFENGDAIEFSGSVGNISKDYGIKYGHNTNIDKGNLYVAAGQPCHVSGTLTLDEATSDLYIGRYGGTTTYFTTFTIRQLTAATSETFTGVKIGGSAATEDVDYTVDGSTITLTGTFTTAPTIALVNHIVFADESVEDQNLLVAFGAPNGEFYTGTVTIDGTTYTVKAPCGQINALKVEYKDGETTVKEEHIDVTGLKVGASYTVPFHMYVEKDGALYQTTKNGSDPWYGDVVTLAYNTTVTKTVTPVDLGGGIIELFEDFDGSTENYGGVRGSNCSTYNSSAYTSTNNLPAGEYKFIVKAYNRGRGSSVKVGDTKIFDFTEVGGAWTDKTFEDVIIPTAGKLTFVAGGSKTYDPIDILIAIRTGDAVVNITPANDKSTYVTTYALDFSDVEGLKAYAATNAAAGVVTLEEVGTVPAGTPLMLVGTATTEYTVPVVASADAPAMNMFRAGDGTTVFDGSTYDYILYTDGLFYQIGSGSVAVGKAYLHCTSDPTAPLSRELSISFGGVTSVEAVEAAKVKAMPVKRIVNGKLVIENEGDIFNAFGQKLSK